MRKKRFTPVQFIRFLQEAGDTTNNTEICRRYAISKQNNRLRAYSRLCTWVCVVDTLAFVADGTEGLQVIDVNDPEYPEIIGWIEIPGMAEGVSVLAPYAYYAYVTTGNELVIIDVSDYLTPS